MPKVSIIVPVYNVEKYLDQCMQSLLNQTLNDIEIIMVDDESPDNCPKLCDEYAKYDSRIKVIHKKNGGLGLARNSGIEIATGDYIAFVDSDDYVEKTMFEIMYKKAQKNKSDIVYCNNYMYHSELGSITKSNAPLNYDETFKGRDVIEEVLKNMIASSLNASSDRKYYMSVWRGIFKKEAVNGIRFVSEREYLSEDILYQVKALQHANSVTIISDYLYYYRENLSSLTHKYRKDRIQKSIILYQCLTKELKGITLDDMEDWNFRLLKFLYGYFRFSLFSNIAAKASISNLKEDFKYCCDYFNKISFYSKYPVRVLPYKHKLILFLFKHNMFYCFYFLAKIAK